MKKLKIFESNKIGSFNSDLKVGNDVVVKLVWQQGNKSGIRKGVIEDFIVDEYGNDAAIIKFADSKDGTGYETSIGNVCNVSDYNDQWGKLGVFESIDKNSEQIQDLLRSIRNFYKDFGDTISESDWNKYSGVSESGKKAWELERRFFEYYDGTNFDQIIQMVISDDKEFIYESFLELIKGRSI